MGEPIRPIRMTAMFVADHAEAVGGKLYVTGGCWDRLAAGELPAVHPHLSLAISMRVPSPSRPERHSLNVRLLDPEGHDALGGGVRSEFEVAPLPEHPPELPVLMVVNFNALQLRLAGRYDFAVLVDGEELARTDFQVSPTVRRPTAD
ncbi:MAG: DUF6941 family protein [Candidatus Dormibacteraceae bacterium]